ncbi:hypothetical protein DFO66_10459 [Brevibacterium sanguinis]|uniref:Uncharacterized protein n=2 Tax=Brevibacterium TaxID=1696 RepID=A0A366IJ13_9MICO|nr:MULTISPECIES: hypothetical protein [Brevibacterium]RBP65476.1 hypothetical protein DFO66_10459 [Brevibacterium sanguinis]RBP72110.1 hypothetical protein DFO65_10465 [Brevibacterium celere]
MTSTQPPEQTTSGLIDAEFVRRFAPLYSVTELEAELFDSIGPKTARREYYKRKGFLRVAEWKAVAVLPTLESLDPDDIEYVTAVALDEDTPNRLRVPFLQVLPGVGVPLASTLLAVVDPKRFAIMDARAVGVLNEFALIDTSNPARLDYSTYRRLVRSLAKGAGCGALDLYRALIACSRQPRG